MPSKAQISDLQEFVRRFSANASKARQATRGGGNREDQIEESAVVAQNPTSASSRRRSSTARPCVRAGLPLSGPKRTFSRTSLHHRGWKRVAVIGPTASADDADAFLAGTDALACRISGSRTRSRLHAPGPAGRIESRPTCSAGCRLDRARRTTTSSFFAARRLGRLLVLRRRDEEVREGAVSGEKGA